jgi:hypothetical protein
MKQYTYLMLLVVGFWLAAGSCKKAEYLTDEGIHSAKTPLSTYEYLQSNQYKLFDTLLLLIDRLNLREEMEDSKTVFAVTDYSMKRYMDMRQAQLRLVNENLVYNLDSLYKDMKPDSIRQYFFDKKFTLADAVIEPEVETTTSKGNTTCGISKRRFDINELKQDGGLPNFTNTPAYGLYYTRVRGALDVPGIIPPANEIDIKVLCQTSGIEPSPPSKGAAYEQVLHVLSNQHTFARF